MQRTTRVRTLAAAAAALSIACGGDRGAAFDPSAAAALAGSWSVELVATRPLLGRDSGAVAHGALVLVANRPRAAVRGAVPTDYGAHAVDTRPLGFDLLTGGEFPGVVAVLGPHDTVSIRFVPEPSGRSFEIRGRLEDGVIRGEWMLDQRIGGAAGTALLRRTASAQPRGDA